MASVHTSASIIHISVFYSSEIKDNIDMIFGFIASVVTIVLYVTKYIGYNPVISYACIALAGTAIVESLFEMFGKNQTKKVLAIIFTSLAMAIVIYFVFYRTLGLF